VFGNQTDWAEQGNHPDTEGARCDEPCNLPRGCGVPIICTHKHKCRVPSSKGKDNPGDPFPVYYTIRQCSETIIRVQYNLFYEKDGFYDGNVEYGHA
jgi:hypothetical protein